MIEKYVVIFTSSWSDLEFLYVYAVEYIGNMSFEEASSYKQFLEEFGYSVYYKNINLDYSFSKIEIRPWADKGGRISTDRTTHNKELLIVEKENDGKPFELHTTAGDKIEYYRALLRPSLFNRSSPFDYRGDSSYMASAFGSRPAGCPGNNSAA